MLTGSELTLAASDEDMSWMTGGCAKSRSSGRKMITKQSTGQTKKSS